MKPSFSLVVPAIALGVLFSFSPEASGFGGAPGGPFDNGSYFPNDGTFSAVIRGENLSGVLQFSTTAGSGPVPEAGQETTGSFQPYDSESTAIGGLGSTGVATIYYDGDTYLGNSQGAYNPTVSTMAVTFQADLPGQGEQDVRVLTPVTVDIPNVITENGTTTTITTQETTFQATRRYLYLDSVYLNGFANCRTMNAFPTQKFAGKGEAELQFLDFSSGEPVMVAQSFPLSVTGVRLSNAASAFATRAVSAPSVNSLSVLQQ